MGVRGNNSSVLSPMAVSRPWASLEQTHVFSQAPEDSWDDYYRLVFDAIHTKIFKTQSA